VCGRVRWLPLASLVRLLARNLISFRDASNEDAMLNDTLIRSAKPRERDYKLSDFDGLYLLVCSNGSKLWRFAYRFDGKQKQIELGAYPQSDVGGRPRSPRGLTQTARQAQGPKHRAAVGEDRAAGRRQHCNDPVHGFVQERAGSKLIARNCVA